MFKILWTDPAIRDLKAIFEYIARDSEYYAKGILDDIFEKVEVLETFPNSGRIVSEENDKNTREIFVERYRIIYEIKESMVHILTIVHMAQDFEA
jgi:addiction module RelE/StbE family toxin